MRSLELDPYALPKLPGISTLSVEEVKNDLRELQGNDDDTDSDCSVCSKDVLTSIYPVKPRSYRKIPSKDSASYSRRQEGDNESTGGAVFDEALAFIKNVHINHSALYNQELEREKLENMSKWYEESLTTDRKSFSAVRSEEENYIRAMQGLYLRSLKYQHSLSEQNMMIHRLYRALKERRDTAQALDHEIEKVKSFLSTKKTNKAAMVSAAEPQYLKVHLNHDDSDVVIYVDQILVTPYGKGTVKSFDVASLTVTIKLPFGQMYSHVSRVVCWCELSVTNAEINAFTNTTESSLIQAYDTLHASSSLLSIPWSEKLAIYDLVSSLPPTHAEDESGTATDKEDGDGESESDSPSDNDDEEEGEPMDEEDGSVQSRTNEIAEFLTHTGDSNGASSTAGQQGSSYNGKNGTGGAVSTTTTVFPIVNNAPAAHTRREARAQLAAQRDLHLRSVTSDKLKVALAPPGALPYLLSSSSSSSSCRNGIKFDLSAFDEPSSIPLGSTGSMCYEGDIAALRSSLLSIGNQIAQLKANNLQLAQRMNYSRSSCTRIASETASLRVGMFTRRIVHRNNLGSAGAVLGGPPAPTSTVPMATSAVVGAVEVKSENGSGHSSTDIKQEVASAEEAGYSSSASADEVNSAKRDAGQMEGAAAAGAATGDDKDDTSPAESKKKSSKRTRRSY